MSTITDSPSGGKSTSSCRPDEDESQGCVGHEMSNVSPWQANSVRVPPLMSRFNDDAGLLNKLDDTETETTCGDDGC